MKYVPLILCCFFLCTLPGCGGQEYTYVDERDMKPGPGLLSGEAGGFYLFGGQSSSEKNTTEKQQQQNEETVDLQNQ